MSVSAQQVQNLGVRRHQVSARNTIPIQPRGGVVFYPGSAIVHRINTNIAEIPASATPRTDLVSLGYYAGLVPFTASSTTDGNGGALDANGQPQSITIAAFGVTGYFSTGTGANQITLQSLDARCYWYDDDTLYLTDLGGTLSFAGWVDDVVQSGPYQGKVILRTEPSTRALTQLLSASEATPGATSDNAVSYVMTNLPAGTFSGGVWTATATGALNTTQDGLTVAPAVGDLVIFPPGTITTLVVSAANSGPYECTVAGATGVKAVYTRPSWFAHGAIITPGTRVRVTLGGATTFGGTVWRCDPTTAAKVVGTDDPVMFPERVVVQKTCSSGTATIATVPLRAAGKFGVYCDFNGGTPAATTTSIQASTQTPGALGTASIVIQEQSVLGTLVNTGTAQVAVTILQ
jgi:hypothetical protein